jgi:uncharacterized protein (TIGR00369 family)
VLSSLSEDGVPASFKRRYATRILCLLFPGLERPGYIRTDATRRKPDTMHAPNPSFAREVERSFARQSIMKLIGAKLSLIEPGVIEITLPYRADLTQQHGFLHAGVVTTIADSACGYAAYSLMPAGSEVLSVEFKVNLLRPAQGESFVARAEVIKAGRTLTVVRADVFGIAESGSRNLVATMQATMIAAKVA